MTEVSFTFHCSEDSLQFLYNYNLVNLESAFINGSKIIKLHTNNSRVSFENGRFFDPHNLIVKKGAEAEESIKDQLKNVKDIIIDGLNKASIEFDLPVSLIKRYVDDLSERPLNLKPTSYLDFEISEILLEINKVFFDRNLNMAGDVIPQRILKLFIKSKKGCTRLQIKEGSKTTLEYSEDCELWSEDSLKVLSIVSSLHPTIIEVKELLDYLKRVCRV
ncbi:hypothetical protein [Stygiolobus caldivivus]|uniref:Uncharacterized protein n=1 Tax=Stygiolobus caldivivus TaxID=2824673 RepID=A0A8D5ZE43_9CREN|nr:hypothetical protein [Stygiolobus caldivivus]BCU69448.1 hypothetical protein KN1_07450 [Stygiolobus caldivivus]